MKPVVIDIETIPDESKRELFRLFSPPSDEEIKKNDLTKKENYDRWENFQMSVHPMYCIVVGLNYMVD